MNELKPCPFCGGEAIMNVIAIDWRGVDRRYYQAACLDCSIEQPPFCYEVENDAIKAWNRRVNDENPGGN